MVHPMLYYNHKEVIKMSKRYKHTKKPTIDWRTLLATAIMDLIVGIILLILDKLI